MDGSGHCDALICTTSPTPSRVCDRPSNETYAAGADCGDAAAPVGVVTVSDGGNRIWIIDESGSMRGRNDSVCAAIGVIKIAATVGDICIPQHSMRRYDM